MIADISANGANLTINFGQQGPPGPAGPLPANVITIDMVGNGAGGILLASTPALPAAAVGSQVITGYVTAQDQVSGDVAVWQVVAACKLDGTGVLSFPGQTGGSQAPNPAVTLLVGDSSMLDATVQVTLGANNMQLVGQGLGAQAVVWTGELTLGGNGA